MEKKVNKSIGFLLTGNTEVSDENVTLDADQIYEIELFFKKPALANLINIRKNETKAVPVELPKALTDANYEKAYALFLQNDLRLTATIQGHEKIGNKKLVVEFGNSLNQFQAQVGILIEGVYKEAKYRININPYDISLTVGEIREKGFEDYKKIKVDVGRLKEVEAKTLRKVLLKLQPTNIQVEIQAETIFISLNEALMQLTSKPIRLRPRLKETQTPSGEKEVPVFHFFEEEQSSKEDDVPEEVDIKKQDPEILKVLNRRYSWESFAVFQTFMHSLEENSFANVAILEILYETLQRMQILYFQHESRKRKGDHFDYSNTLLDVIEPEICLKMLNFCVHAMHLKTSSCEQLKVAIGLLNIVAIKGIKDSSQKLFNQMFEMINSPMENPSFEMSFLTSYFKQSFQLMTGELADEVQFSEVLKSFLDHSLIKADQVQEEPKGFFSKLISKIPSWKNQNRWFEQLFMIRKKILNDSGEEFLKFSLSVKENFQLLRKEVDIENPYFIYGFLEILWEIIYFPEFEKVDEKVKLEASELLNLIYLNSQKRVKELPFYLEDEQFSQELHHKIQNYALKTQNKN
jgi:hypothetical protein